MKFKNLKIKIAMVISFSVVGLSANAKSAYLPEKESCKNMLGTDLVFPKKNKFVVYEYVAETDTFNLLNPDLPGEDFTEVTLSGLAAGVSKIKKNWDNIIANPEDIVGETYIGENDVPGLTEKEMAARKGCSRVKP